MPIADDVKEAVDDYFMDLSSRIDVDEALRQTAERFQLSRAEVEAILTEMDALNSGNG